VNKKDLSERDICTKLIIPALLAAGWTQSQIREEVRLSAGRVIVRGKLAYRIATRPKPDLRGSNHDDKRATQQTARRNSGASGFALTRGVRHHSFLSTRLGERFSDNRFRRHAFCRRLGGHGGSGRIRGRAARASELYAETRKAGTPVDDMDILIAGIALAHGRIVFTCNTDHFN
jgi:hypothetical protein